MWEAYSVDGVALRRIVEEPLGGRFKGLPHAEDVTLDTVAAQKWNVLAGDLLLPVMVLKDSAVRHNVQLMADYCREHGVELAPHGKTSMAPQLFAQQIDAGAWGITAATVSHVRLYRTYGVQRVLMANQIVERTAAQWVVAELDRSADFEFLCLVDSLAGVAILRDAIGDRAGARPLRVLVELGQVGGRTGCRSIDEAVALAAAVNAAPGIELAGVGGFEGLITAGSPAQTLAAVDDFLADLRRLTQRLADEGHFAHLAEVVVTAGGSSYFDLVVRHLTGWSSARPIRTILRSGCYVTHDVALYEDVSPLAQRHEPDEPRRLRQALELWATVLSRPEPELIIAGFGKRDAPYDYRLPVPLAFVNGSGELRDVRGSFGVEDMNDQHAYLRVPADSEVRVGDLVCLGINHPCTAFDKWQLLPVVDDEYTVVGGIRTFF